MYIGTITDCGLSYSAKTVKEIAEKLNEYILEVYGPHRVHNCKTGTTYAGCHIISSPGQYFIESRKDKNISIFCTISADT